MALTNFFVNSTVGNYVKSIRAAPRQVLLNGNLLFSTVIFAMAAFPNCWDQGASSTLPVLPGFQEHFGLSESDFISLVYLGMGAGAALSFFINDRIGRLWSFRVYTAVWIVGQLINAYTPNKAGLDASRIVGGLGIGALSAIGTMAIVEIAPAEIRGLLAAWYNVAMLLGLVISTFSVYGVYIHLPTGRFQYQVICWAPCIFMALCIGASFFACESPRWLFLVGRRDEAIATLVKIRGLTVEHPRMRAEIGEIEESIRLEQEGFGDHGTFSDIKGILKETFTVPSNLRRVQQSLVTYALAQLSGANAITSYLVPILNLLGTSGGQKQSLFLSGMYGLSKFFFILIASFLFIDALGRRNSLFVGTTIQLLTDIYIGVYIKYSHDHDAPEAASQAALAFIFLHAFGYAVGLYLLPYIFGSELWPNRIRSFGSAMSQCFHWLFAYAINAALPLLLSKTNNWGAFIFFAAWCFASLVYVFFMVPELAGLSLEQIDHVFEGPWFKAYKAPRPVPTINGVENGDLERDQDTEGSLDRKV